MAYTHKLSFWLHERSVALWQSLAALYTSCITMASRDILWVCICCCAFLGLLLCILDHPTQWCLGIVGLPVCCLRRTRPDDMAITRVLCSMQACCVLCVLQSARRPSASHRLWCCIARQQWLSVCDRGAQYVQGPRALLVCDRVALCSRETQMACRDACRACHSFQSSARYTCYMFSDHPLHPLLSLATADAAGLTGCSSAAALHIHTWVVARSVAAALLSGAWPVTWQPACSTQSGVECCFWMCPRFVDRWDVALYKRQSCSICRSVSAITLQPQ